MTRDAWKFQIHWTIEMVVPICVNESSKGGFGIPGNPLSMLESDNKISLGNPVQIQDTCNLLWLEPLESGKVSLIQGGFWLLINCDIIQDNERNGNMDSPQGWAEPSMNIYFGGN